MQNLEFNALGPDVTYWLCTVWCSEALRLPTGNGKLWMLLCSIFFFLITVFCRSHQAFNSITKGWQFKPNIMLCNTQLASVTSVMENVS